MELFQYSWEWWAINLQRLGIHFYACSSSFFYVWELFIIFQSLLKFMDGAKKNVNCFRHNFSISSTLSLMCKRCSNSSPELLVPLRSYASLDDARSPLPDHHILGDFLYLFCLKNYTPSNFFMRSCNAAFYFFVNFS